MSATILVVEDEPAIQELVAYACQTNGFKVRRSDSVRAAREAVSGELPDLVLLDWMLPDRPGIELLREFRGQERTKALPVIMLTAKGSESDKVAGLDAGRRRLRGEALFPARARLAHPRRVPAARARSFRAR